jgi:hypothetical protein
VALGHSALLSVSICRQDSYALGNILDGRRTTAHKGIEAFIPVTCGIEPELVEVPAEFEEADDCANTTLKRKRN